MGTLITLITIYLTGVVLARKWIQRAYSEGGVWQWEKPGGEDILIVITPVANLVILLIYIIGEGSWDGKEPKEKTRSFTKRFFNVK